MNHVKPKLAYVHANAVHANAVRANAVRASGFTLIELVIVVAVLAILMTLAVPNYRQYALRVQRGEAINMLLQAAMCQERVYARSGDYDTGSCLIDNKQNRYQISYQIISY